MAASYPGSIKTFTEKVDDVTDVMAVDVNDLQDEVAAIETELGADVAGTATNLVTRLARSLSGTGNVDFASSTNLTIASGSITPTQNWHTVDTESAAASDDLDTIAITNATDGFILFLRQFNSARIVTIKHNTGNIYCPGAVDIVMTGTSEVTILIYDATLSKWLAITSPANTGLLNDANTWSGMNTFSKALNFSYTSATTDITIDTTHFFVDVDATAGNLTVTLPTSVGANGREYIIRKLDSGANTVTVTPDGTETINGSSDKVLTEQYDATIIFSDGANWVELATGGGGGTSSDLIEHTHTGSTDGGLLRLDTISAPTDSTTLNASTDAHGLLPKLSGTATEYMNGTGAWSTPSGASTDLAEHDHSDSDNGGLIRLDTIAAPTDSTSLNASTDAHGLLPKLSGNTLYFLRSDGSWATIPTAGTTQYGAVRGMETSDFISGTTDTTFSILRYISQDNFNALMRSGTTDFDASTDTHGFLPKLSGSSDQYMNGIGEWGTPAGGGGGASSDLIELTPTGSLELVNRTVHDYPTLSSEFLDEDNWTLGAGWSGDFVTGFIHASGTATLAHDHAAANATKYQISYTVTGRTAGSFNLSFGGQTVNSISASGAFGPTATNTDPLTITPTTDFDGTIVISTKSITNKRSPIFVFRNSSGDARFEIMNINEETSFAIGRSAGTYATTSFGVAAIGAYALENLTTGNNNTAIGYSCGRQLTTGGYNVAIGNSSLYKSVNGNNNTGVGATTLYELLSGYRNTAIGYNAGRTITTGSDNTFIGYQAGYNASQKVNASNSMALGNGAYTTDNNQVVIGNTSITSTILHGSITLDEGGDIVLGTTTGTKIGTATSQKLGFFNTTPVVQRSHIADATDATNVITQFNSLLLALEQLGLLAAA